MKCLGTVKGCTKAAQLGNEDTRNKLDLFPLFEKITECRGIWGQKMSKDGTESRSIRGL